MFDLDREYTTRNGLPVDIICRTFKNSAHAPCQWIGVIHWCDYDSIQFYTDEGRAITTGGMVSDTVSRFDLMHKSAHHIAYVAILNEGLCSRRFDTLWGATSCHPSKPIVKVEWDE